MTRYYGVDHYSNDLAGAASWCREHAREDRDYDYAPRSRRSHRCTCNSASESPCDYCSDDSWCRNCEKDTDECICDEIDEEE